MPQGRRKTPFSGKAKKEQLKAKKQSKNDVAFTQGKHSKDTNSNQFKCILLKRQTKESSTSSTLRR